MDKKTKDYLRFQNQKKSIRKAMIISLTLCLLILVGIVVIQNNLSQESGILTAIWFIVLIIGLWIEQHYYRKLQNLKFNFVMNSIPNKIKAQIHVPTSL